MDQNQNMNPQSQGQGFVPRQMSNVSSQFPNMSSQSQVQAMPVQSQTQGVVSQIYQGVIPQSQSQVMPSQSQVQVVPAQSQVQAIPTQSQVQSLYPQQTISAQQVAQVVTPQQVQQAMTPEELQRTQVLNLDDVKETARIERLSSKKPSALLASFGVLLIAVGLLFPSFQSYLDGKKETTNDPVYREEEEPVVVEPVEETVNCTLEILNNPNGTDEVLTVNYVFVDDALTTYTKDYLLRQSATVTETPAELANYLSALEPFLAQQIPGYKMSLQQIANGSVTRTEVDYNLLDYNAIPMDNLTNYRFDVPFQSTATINEVRVGLTEQGYTCQ